MLIEFAVTNFRSIQEEARISLVANSANEHRETNLFSPQLAYGDSKLRLLRSTALFGANGAGKSNFLRALHTMREIVVSSTKKINLPLPFEPFLLDTKATTMPTTFEVTCIIAGVRYEYGFSVTAKAIHEEWLFACPLGRTQMWFERTRLDSGESSFQFGDKLLGAKEVWRNATRDNALFLSTAASLNSQQLAPLWYWFAESLRVTSRGWNSDFTLDYCTPDAKPQVLEFMRAADLAIDDVRVVDEEFSPEMLAPSLSLSDRQRYASELAGKKWRRARVGRHLAGDRSVEWDLEEESDGTKKLFALTGLWLDCLNRGLIIVIDELHEHMHPELIRFLVEKFHDPTLNKKGAQIIFSTHDTSILSQDLFRRDQIWFCERGKDLATKLYPLTDFRPRKSVENLERAYRSGRYGALPWIERSHYSNSGEHPS